MTFTYDTASEGRKEQGRERNFDNERLHIIFSQRPKCSASPLTTPLTALETP